MKEKIKEKLFELEEEYDVDILSARDFGSTAWNLDSPESDRDIAFVFKQDKLDYAKIGTYKGNIDRMFEINGKEHSFMGWNLKRFMELLDGSNPTTIEYLNSPINYYVKDLEINSAFVDLRKHANENFKPIGLFYHYRSLAKSNYNQYIKNENHKTVKRHLYVLRALMYARYVESTHKFPPLDFQDFLEFNAPSIDNIPSEIIEHAHTLVTHKTKGRGMKSFENEELEEWIESELDNHLDDDEHNIRGIDRDMVNNIMEAILNEVV